VYGLVGREDADEFTLDRYGDPWRGKKRPHVMTFNEGVFPTNLIVDHYVWDKGDRILVLVAFRGTYPVDTYHFVRDWLSNASWFFRWLPVADHYDDARRAFEKIRAEVLAEAKGRPVNFVATGHSLGGGLAMHIASNYHHYPYDVFNKT
jgi:hypothetical protein